MSLKTVKRLAAKEFKCGTTHVKILDASEAAKALTADDVRDLIARGLIKKTQKKGVGRAKAKRKAKRRHAGRRRGPGSRKGAAMASVNKKKRWMRKVRAQRELLKKLKPRLEEGVYSRLYKMVKGNNFRSKRQLLAFVQENKWLK